MGTEKIDWHDMYERRKDIEQVLQGMAAQLNHPMISIWDVLGIVQEDMVVFGEMDEPPLRMRR